jgi:hypothetical protein
MFGLNGALEEKLPFAVDDPRLHERVYKTQLQTVDGLSGHTSIDLMK